MPNPLKSRILSFKYAFAGLADLFKTQPNALIHLSVAILVVIAGFFFDISATEWAVVVLAIGMVISAEAFNTGLEHLTDLVSPDPHPLAGKTKDVAAAGVLLAAFGAAGAGLIIFLPKVLAWLQG